MEIALPGEGGRLQPYTLTGATSPTPPTAGPLNRTALAAVHVVADPFAAAEPSQSAAIDWAATLEFRRYVVGLGLGIAEAMDTAQRGNGLDWRAAEELIRLPVRIAGCPRL
jgi:hypothetical protein